jgi:hypothetical protein
LYLFDIPVVVVTRFHKKPKHKINIPEVLVTRYHMKPKLESLSGVGQGDQVMDGVLYNYKLKKIQTGHSLEKQRSLSVLNVQHVFLFFSSLFC